MVVFASNSLEVNTDFGERSAAGAQRRPNTEFKVWFVCLSFRLLPEAANVRLFRSNLQVETFVCVFVELEHTHTRTRAPSQTHTGVLRVLTARSQV